MPKKKVINIAITHFNWLSLVNQYLNPTIIEPPNNDHARRNYLIFFK
jgi:hypothetical protein